MLWDMKEPIFVHTLSENEHEALEAGLRSKDAFVLRRCQILLASDRALESAAQASLEEGLTKERVSGETIRATLARELGVRWKRAKRWITSPDPEYQRKKGVATG